MAALTGAEVRQRRLAICRSCLDWRGQCRLGHDPGGQEGCPRKRFPGYVPLGNVAATFFKPIAQAVGISNCPGCARRQDRWNHLLKRV